MSSYSLDLVGHPKHDQQEVFRSLHAHSDTSMSGEVTRERFHILVEDMDADMLREVRDYYMF